MLICLKLCFKKNKTSPYIHPKMPMTSFKSSQTLKIHLNSKTDTSELSTASSLLSLG